MYAISDYSVCMYVRAITHHGGSPVIFLIHRMASRAPLCHASVSSAPCVSAPSTEARRLRSSRHELVAAREATSTSELILFRAFVQALGGLDPCRNGRKRCRKHGLNRYTHRETHRFVFFWHPGADFFPTEFRDPLYSSCLRRRPH